MNFIPPWEYSLEQNNLNFTSNNQSHCLSNNIEHLTLGGDGEESLLKEVMEESARDLAEDAIQYNLPEGFTGDFNNIFSKDEGIVDRLITNLTKDSKGPINFTQRFKYIADVVSRTIEKLTSIGDRSGVEAAQSDLKVETGTLLSQISKDGKNVNLESLPNLANIAGKTENTETLKNLLDSIKNDTNMSHFNNNVLTGLGEDGKNTLSDIIEGGSESGKYKELKTGINDLADTEDWKEGLDKIAKKTEADVNKAAEESGKKVEDEGKKVIEDGKKSKWSKYAKRLGMLAGLGGLGYLIFGQGGLFGDGSSSDKCDENCKACRASCMPRFSCNPGDTKTPPSCTLYTNPGNMYPCPPGKSTCVTFKPDSASPPTTINICNSPCTTKCPASGFCTPNANFPPGISSPGTCPYNTCASGCSKPDIMNNIEKCKSFCGAACPGNSSSPSGFLPFISNITKSIIKGLSDIVCQVAKVLSVDCQTLLTIIYIIGGFMIYMVISPLGNSIGGMLGDEMYGQLFITFPIIGLYAYEIYINFYDTKNQDDNK
jgi:hypothetical protein